MDPTEGEVKPFTGVTVKKHSTMSNVLHFKNDKSLVAVVTDPDGTVWFNVAGSMKKLTLKELEKFHEEIKAETLVVSAVLQYVKDMG